MPTKVASKETRQEIKTYEVDAECSECKQGKMRPTGFNYYGYPVMYPHMCTKCGFKEDYDVLYPRIVKEKV
jgi:hypothetical protein